MELVLTRIAKRSDYTIGRLTKGIGGDYICDTLEPPVVETKRYIIIITKKSLIFLDVRDISYLMQCGVPAALRQVAAGRCAAARHEAARKAAQRTKVISSFYIIYSSEPSEQWSLHG